VGFRCLNLNYSVHKVYSRQCLFAEQQKQSQAERTLNEQMNALRAENQGLGQKVREFQGQLAAKMQAYRQVESQLMQCRVDQAHAVQAQQLREVCLHF